MNNTGQCVNEAQSSVLTFCSIGSYKGSKCPDHPPYAKFHHDDPGDDVLKPMSYGLAIGLGSLAVILLIFIVCEIFKKVKNTHVPYQRYEEDSQNGSSKNEGHEARTNENGSSQYGKSN